MFGREINLLKNSSEVIRFLIREFVPHLELTDFVIYKYDPPRGLLTKCASLNKIYFDRKECYSDFTLTPGSGIVGKSAKMKQSVVIGNTEDHIEYIVDEQKRYSELCSPVIFKNRLIGVIDSEHIEKDFYSDELRQVFETIATMIAPHLRDVRTDQGENEHYRKFTDMLTMDRIYLDKDLTLDKVAGLLQLTPGHFSSILSLHSSVKFRDLVNQYRIAHFVWLADNSLPEHSLLSLAFAAGFNSKATFNRVFKNMMGTCPKTYLRNRN